MQDGDVWSMGVCGCVDQEQTDARRRVCGVSDMWWRGGLTPTLALDPHRVQARLTLILCVCVCGKMRAVTSR